MSETLPVLRIRLMGSMSLVLEDRSLPIGSFETRKARTLFAFLALKGGRVLARELVASEFWGDLPDSRARKALNTNLYRVRSFLCEAGLPPERYLHSGSDGIGFRTDSPHWLDVAQIEEAVSRAVRTSPEDAGDPVVGGLQEAVALYRGDLLEDVHDDWCLVRREAARASHMTALEFLMRVWMVRSNWQRAVACGKVLLGFDPLQENVHRALMRCYYAMGNRPAAVKQYQACARVLQEELGVEPMEETAGVYAAVLTASQYAAIAGGAVAREPERHANRTGASELEAVNLAIASLDRARSLLTDAIRGWRATSGLEH